MFTEMRFQELWLWQVGRVQGWGAHAQADSKGEGVRGASEGREGTPQETEAQRRKREEVLLANAAAVRAVRATLSLAYQRPHPEPAAAPTNGDYVLQEMRWLATDFGQVSTAPFGIPRP